MRDMTLTVEDDYDGPEPCPMGCGGLTDDVYGGPCSRCWSDLYSPDGDDPRSIYDDAEEDYD